MTWDQIKSKIKSNIGSYFADKFDYQGDDYLSKTRIRQVEVSTLGAYASIIKKYYDISKNTLVSPLADWLDNFASTSEIKIFHAPTGSFKPVT